MPTEEEKLRYWQYLTGKQLGFSIHLIMTLALTTLGYILSTYDEANKCCAIRCVFLIGSVLLSISVVCGIVASLTRLCDFRCTAKIIRTEDTKEKNSLRESTKTLGRITWFFFWSETVTFFLGFVFSAILTMINKLL